MLSLFVFFFVRAYLLRSPRFPRSPRSPGCLRAEFSSDDWPKMAVGVDDSEAVFLYEHMSQITRSSV